jgi:hypothetical protein
LVERQGMIGLKGASMGSAADCGSNAGQPACQGPLFFAGTFRIDLTLFDFGYLHAQPARVTFHEHRNELLLR